MRGTFSLSWKRFCRLINSTLIIYDTVNYNYDDDESHLRIFSHGEYEKKIRSYIYNNVINIIKKFYESDNYLFGIQISAPGHWVSVVISKVKNKCEIYFQKIINNFCNIR